MIIYFIRFLKILLKTKQHDFRYLLIALNGKANFLSIRKPTDKIAIDEIKAISKFIIIYAKEIKIEDNKYIDVTFDGSIHYYKVFDKDVIYVV